MRNDDIKTMIKDAGLRMWQVAEVYGIADCHFSRKLRYELTEADRNRIIDIINTLAERKNCTTA